MYLNPPALSFRDNTPHPPPHPLKLHQARQNGPARVPTRGGDSGWRRGGPVRAEGRSGGRGAARPGRRRVARRPPVVSPPGVRAAWRTAPAGAEPSDRGTSWPRRCRGVGPRLVPCPQTLACGHGPHRGPPRRVLSRAGARSAKAGGPPHPPIRQARRTRRHGPGWAPAYRGEPREPRGHGHRIPRTVRNTACTAPINSGSTPDQWVPGAVRRPPGHCTPCHTPAPPPVPVPRRLRRWRSAPAAGQSFANAASKDVSGSSIAARARTNSKDWGAPCRRSMPASSHSTEIGPS